MAMEVKGPFVDSKTVTTAGTPEALTTREVSCTSVYIVASESNSGANVYIVDRATTSKKVRVPASGLTLPNTKPANIFVDVDTSGDAVEWAAV